MPWLQSFPVSSHEPASSGDLPMDCRVFLFASGTKSKLGSSGVEEYTAHSLRSSDGSSKWQRAAAKERLALLLV